MQFFSEEVTYLGFCINENRIFLVKEKTEDLLNSKLPKDVMQPKLFLGMMNCYHRPWHDTRAIAHARAITRANQEKGGFRR